jgi:hypothetical protein
VGKPVKPRRRKDGIERAGGVEAEEIGAGGAVVAGEGTDHGDATVADGSEGADDGAFRETAAAGVERRIELAASAEAHEGGSEDAADMGERTADEDAATGGVHEGLHRGRREECGIDSGIGDAGRGEAGEVLARSSVNFVEGATEENRTIGLEGERGDGAVGRRRERSIHETAETDAGEAQARGAAGERGERASHDEIAGGLEREGVHVAVHRAADRGEERGVERAIGGGEAGEARGGHAVDGGEGAADHDGAGRVDSEDRVDRTIGAVAHGCSGEGGVERTGEGDAGEVVAGDAADRGERAAEEDFFGAVEGLESEGAHDGAGVEAGVEGGVGHAGGGEAGEAGSCQAAADTGELAADENLAVGLEGERGDIGEARRREHGIERAVGVQAGEAAGVGGTDEVEIAGDDDLAVGLHDEAGDGIIDRRRDEGEIDGAVGIKAGEARARHTADAGEAAGDEEFAVGEGLHLRDGGGIEGGQFAFEGEIETVVEHEGAGGDDRGDGERHGRRRDEGAGGVGDDDIVDIGGREGDGRERERGAGRAGERDAVAAPLIREPVAGGGDRERGGGAGGGDDGDRRSRDHGGGGDGAAGDGEEALAIGSVGVESGAGDEEAAIGAEGECVDGASRRNIGAEGGIDRAGRGQPGDLPRAADIVVVSENAGDDHTAIRLNHERVDRGLAVRKSETRIHIESRVDGTGRGQARDIPADWPSIDEKIPPIIKAPSACGAMPRHPSRRWSRR